MVYNVIKDGTKLNKKENGKYVYDSHYCTEMDEEDYQRVVNKLKTQIKKAHELIDKNDVEKKVAKVVEGLKKQLVVDKEALKNFDKFFEEQIAEIIKGKEAKRTELKERIDNHLKIKEITIANVRARNEQQLEPFKYQLKQDTKMLKLYNEFEAINNVK